MTELQEMIAEEAAKQTDIVIGIAVLCLVAIAGAAWFACITYAARTEKRAKRMIRAIEEKAKAEAKDEITKRGAVAFVDKLKLSEEIKAKDKEITELKADLAALRAEHAELVQTAKGVKGVPVLVKRGAFE